MHEDRRQCKGSNCAFQSSNQDLIQGQEDELTNACGSCTHTHKGSELSQIEHHDGLGLQTNHAWQTVQVGQQFAAQ